MRQVQHHTGCAGRWLWTHYTYQKTFDKNPTVIIIKTWGLRYSFCCDVRLLSLYFSMCSEIITVLLLRPWVWPPLMDVWSYRSAFSRRDIILGVSWPILLSICLLLAASWLSGGPEPLCCRSPSYHTLGCRNSPFVMAVISLLCSQVE